MSIFIKMEEGIDDLDEQQLLLEDTKDLELTSAEQECIKRLYKLMLKSFNKKYILSDSIYETLAQYRISCLNDRLLKEFFSNPTGELLKTWLKEYGYNPIDNTKSFNEWFNDVVG